MIDAVYHVAKLPPQAPEHERDWKVYRPPRHTDSDGRTILRNTGDDIVAAIGHARRLAQNKDGITYYAVHRGGRVRVQKV